MGFLDEAFDLIKGGANAVGNAVDDVVPDIKKFLQRFEELGDPSKGPSLLDKAAFLVDTPWSSSRVHRFWRRRRT